MRGRFGPVKSLGFSPDGRVLAAGCQDTTVLLFDAVALSAEMAPPKWSAAGLDALWTDLASPDAATAGLAVGRLAADPADAVPYLTKHVRPAEGKAADEAAVAKLVADLDSDDFDVREKAEHELAAAGPAAAPALRKALENDPSEEVWQRAKRLFGKLPGPDVSPEALRQRRVVEVLERAATPDARDGLEALVKGCPWADLTDDARAALKRLDKRPATAP